ncbi:MAG TPA: heme-binding protein [Planctomycetota bacterium]|nr:heme-binding protein [Planctomycetota bacterium]
MSLHPAIVLAVVILSGPVSAAVALNAPVANDNPVLTADDVSGMLKRAVFFLKARRASGLICVTDREGHILALYRMKPTRTPDFRINEQAIAKARTAAFFQSNEDAFTTRTAQFIVQSHFPPGVKNFEGGPLFGVPFSNFTNSDVQLQQPRDIVFVSGLTAPPALPPGSSNQRDLDQPLVVTPITDDPGGVPLYKEGRAAGGVGVEIDAFGVVGDGVPDAGLKQLGPKEKSKAQLEEQAALAAQMGFAPRREIRADRILVNGLRFPYTNGSGGRVPPTAAQIVLAEEGKFEPFYDTPGSERDPDGIGAGSDAVTAYAAVDPFSIIVEPAQQPRGTPLQEFPKQGWVPRFPPRDSPVGLLSAGDVRQIVQQAADQAFTTRAAIRRPIGVSAQVFIAVVDISGNICGVFRTNDATLFSFDVAVQKARTAAFFSSNRCAISTRAVGFISQTFYPPGLDANPPGPLSGLLPRTQELDVNRLLAQPLTLGLGSGPLTEISSLINDREMSFEGTRAEAVQGLSLRIPHIRDGRLSPLQVALTVDLAFGRPSDDAAPPPTTLPNGITIFPGGFPLYRDGVLIGGIGISGDGVDQDDVIGYMGATGFQPPESIRCDSAPEEDILQTLRAAVKKLQTQFPNLTNDAARVLDVVSSRISKEPLEVFQRLRLPYAKFPRSLER